MTTSRSTPPPLRIALVDDSPLVGHGLLFVNLIRDRAFSHGVELAGYHALNAAEAEPWCHTHGVRWIARVEDFQADAVIIPAASTPESHLPLLRAAAMLGVPVYIDKPLASTETGGAELFALAERHGIPLMSASALRFSSEVQSLRARYPSPHYVEIWSGWREQFDEFFIHAAELLTSLCRGTPECVRRQPVSADLVRYECSDATGIIGAINLCSGDHGFSIAVSDGRQWHFETIRSSFFIQTIEAVITFLRSGVPSVSSAASLQALGLIDRCRSLNLSSCPESAVS